MIAAAVIFAVVPISLSVFGFIASGAGIYIADTQLVNVGAVIAFCPKWFLYLFFVLILAGLISTVDSIICAVSSVGGHDVWQRVYNKYSNKIREGLPTSNIEVWCVDNDVKLARMAMVAVTVIAVLIANIPGLTILYLFLLYGTLRSSVMLPTVFAILGKRMTEKGLFYGILTSMIVGLPVFAYGNLVGNIPLIVAGSLFTILASGLIALDYRRHLKPGPIELKIVVRNVDELNHKLDKLLKKMREARAEMEGLIRDYDELTGKNITISIETEDEKVK